MQEYLESLTALLLNMTFSPFIYVWVFCELSTALINVIPTHLDHGIFWFVRVVPEVLFIVIKSVVNDLHQFAGQFGARGVVSCAVSSRMLAQVRWRLRDNENLVDVSIIDFTVRVFIRPVGESVASAVDLVHLLVKHEVQLLGLVLLLAWRRAGLNRRPSLLCFLQKWPKITRGLIMLNASTNCN